MRELPKQVPLVDVNFWIQVYDLPIGYMSELVGKQLGNFIGRFVEYDANNNSAAWRNYMRIRVAIDIRVPLVRYKMIKKKGGGLHKVSFKYERLGTFCFLCGRLGHSEKFCPMLLEVEGGEVQREWSIELRTPNKRSSMQGQSRWLRTDDNDGEGGDEGGEEVAARKVNSSIFLETSKKLGKSVDTNGPLMKEKN